MMMAIKKRMEVMSEIDSSSEGNEMRGHRRALRMKALCIGALGGLVLLAACAKQPGVTTIQPPPQAAGVPAAHGEVVTPPPVPRPEQPVKQGAQVALQESPLKDIFFDFDRSNIRPDAKVALAEDIGWLRTHAMAAITIAGHCDERGTSEYNLALGERRAQAAKDYLVALGLNTKRVTTVSYGKERPFILGHDESAWKWNRRAHFVVKEK